MLGALVFLLAWALTWINAKYDEVSGVPPGRVTHPRGCQHARRAQAGHAQSSASARSGFLLNSVVAAVLAFEVWFFFFAGSALPNG